MPLPHPPRLDHRVQSLIWAVVLGFVSWLLLMGVGTSLGMATLIGVLLGVLIFFVVHVCGGDSAGPQRTARR